MYDIIIYTDFMKTRPFGRDFIRARQRNYRVTLLVGNLDPPALTRAVTVHTVVYFAKYLTCPLLLWSFGYYF